MHASSHPHTDHYGHIRRNPKFRQLARARRNLAWSLSAAVLGAYYLYMLVVAFAPGWLHSRLHDGSALTWGIPVGAAIIVLSWLSTGWYVHYANTRFDRLSAELIDEGQP